MRVLGIDPGTRYLGLGIVERDGRGAARWVAHALLEPHKQGELPERLAYLFEQIGQIIEKHRPDEVAVEGVFHARNARSAIVLAHARGVALLCAARAKLPVFEYAPATIKKAVGVSGAARKEGVERMVRTLLQLPALERSDCADALAIALCHLQRARPELLTRPARHVIVRRS